MLRSIRETESYLFHEAIENAFESASSSASIDSVDQVNYRHTDHKSYLKSNQSRKKVQVKSNFLADMLKISETANDRQSVCRDPRQPQLQLAKNAGLTVEDLFRRLQLTYDEGDVKRLDEIERTNRLWISQQSVLLKQIDYGRLMGTFGAKRLSRQKGKNSDSSKLSRIKTNQLHKFKSKCKASKYALNEINRKIKIRFSIPTIHSISMTIVYFKLKRNVTLEPSELTELFKASHLKSIYLKCKSFWPRPKNFIAVSIHGNNYSNKRMNLVPNNDVRPRNITITNLNGLALRKKRSRTEEVPKRKVLYLK